MKVPCINPLAIDDNNKVDDSTTSLIVVVEGQDIPNELVSPYALIELSRLVVKGEDLQRQKLKDLLWMEQSNHQL
jgi:hypothetical protein